jgi:SAM-dependent methyltransferase
MSEVNPYRGAYPRLKGRLGVWKEIARYVARDAPEVGTLVELGPGYCDFINQFPARRKIAFDLNGEMEKFAAPEVVFHTASALELPGIDGESVDLVFASNFLEHLSPDELDVMLPNIRRVLTQQGRLILIQPNHRLCAEHYFDDPTHQTIFDDRNVGEWLARHDMSVVHLTPGLLPFSMKSRLPKWGMLTRLYLWSPIKPLAAQMYVVAERS